MSALLAPSIITSNEGFFFKSLIPNQFAIYLMDMTLCISFLPQPAHPNSALHSIHIKLLITRLSGVDQKLLQCYYFGVYRLCEPVFRIAHFIFHPLGVESGSKFSNLYRIHIFAAVHITHDV